MSKFIFTFISVLFAGLFVALAGGIEWGTPVCGLISAFTIIAGLVLSGLVEGFK